MRLLPVTPAKSLNKAYLKQNLKRDQIELFKANLVRMFERIRSDEHEEHLKNIVADFLKDTWYKPNNEINTKGRADLVIHTGKSSGDPVGVIIETKKPSNRTEMITPERPNAKALHELLHYYMQERYIRDNKEIKRLIVCNIYEWYIFDAADFERFFFNNQKLVKSYKDWNDGLLVSTNTDWFYQEIARPFIEKELNELPCVYFNLKEYERVIRNPAKLEDNKLTALYKVLSPPNLLKQPFANDSNSLNKEFYNELLHIIGLEEVKEKGKKLIRRKADGERHDGSLLENTINVLTRRGFPHPGPPPPGEGAGLISPPSGGRPGGGKSSAPEQKLFIPAPVPTPLLEAARTLRSNMTDAEQLLWKCLRGKQLGGYRFRRQHPVERFILDFYCCEAKLAVELDGGQHNEADVRARDDERTASLGRHGIQVIRFWNSEVFDNLEGVLGAMFRALQERTFASSPLPDTPLPASPR